MGREAVLDCTGIFLLILLFLFLQMISDGVKIRRMGKVFIPFVFKIPSFFAQFIVGEIQQKRRLKKHLASQGPKKISFYLIISGVFGVIVTLLYLIEKNFSFITVLK